MRSLILNSILILTLFSSCLIAEELDNADLPIVNILTEELDFGNLPLGEERVMEIEVRNYGYISNKDVFIYGFTIAPDDKEFYMLDTATDIKPISISPHNTKSFRVKFKPNSIRDYNSVIYIKSNAVGVVPIYLEGKCVDYRSNIKYSPNETVFRTPSNLDTISLFLYIETQGKGEIEITDISLEKNDKMFDYKLFDTLPALINDIGISVRIDLAPYKTGTFSNNLIVKSNDSINPTLSIPIEAQIEPPSSVIDFNESDEFIFQSFDEGSEITFSIVSERVLESGTFAIYSQEGKQIKSIVVSGNNTELSVSISRSELPRLSLIRFTQGEKTYVHKHLRE